MKKTLATIIVCLTVIFASLALQSVNRVKGSARKAVFDLTSCCVADPANPDLTTATLCHRDSDSDPGVTATVDCSTDGPLGHENHEFDYCGPCQEATPQDACPNLAGLQGTIPDGYQLIDGQCVVLACEEGSLDVPLNSYGFTTIPLLPNGDLFSLGSSLSLRVTADTLKNGTIFSGDPNNFGPRINPLLPKLAGVKISKASSLLSAVSCQDNFRNLNFFIASQGITDDDTIRLSLQNPETSDSQLLATFLVQGNSAVLTQLNPQATLYLNNRAAFGVDGLQAAGAAIPFGIALPDGALRTEQLTLELRGVPGSTLETCGQLVLDIVRGSATGELSFAFTDITVNRVHHFGDTGNQGQGLLRGLTGGFPTEMLCAVVCPACAVTATPATAGSCNPFCFRSADFFLTHPNQLPVGTVLIGGVNFNTPVSIQAKRQDVLLALRGGFGMLSPQQQLNRQFVAAQLTVQQQGFLGSAETLRLRLNCLHASSLPVTLSSGTTLTDQSTLGDLFEQVRMSIFNQNDADMLVLAGLLSELNSGDAFGFCH